MPPDVTLPASALPKTRSSWAIIASLLPYLWPRSLALRVRVGVALSCLVLAKVASIELPILYKHAVDALTGQHNALLVLPIALIVAYGLVRVGSTLFAELRDAIFETVSQHAKRLINLQVFDHLHQLSLRYHLNRQTGGLTRGVGRGAQAVDSLLYYVLFIFVPTMVELVLIMGILWSMFGLSYAAVILVTVVLYLAWTFSVTEWRTRFYRAMNKAENDANTLAVDSLLNFETVKYFGNERLEATRYDGALQRHRKLTLKSQNTMSLLNTGQTLIICVGLVILMLMAGQGVVNGTMTVGDFVLVNTYMLQLYQPLNYFGMIYRQTKQSLADMEKMLEMMDEEQDIKDAPDAPALNARGGDVRFESVDFGYDARRPILHGVSFDIPAGQTLAVVGPSGAGKSTLSRLLFRFYDVTGGRVVIDGQDIAQVTQASVREQIGIVPQDTVLFNDTIRYNIAYGRPEATPEQVEQAARLAHIHDFILAMPDGYDTVVGERGLKLSGGEKQRVAIARTILKDPEILIFDEATSALDSQTEREIQASLRDVSRGKTTLVIAHRLSTIVDADEIMVLVDGRVAERGTHQALLAQQGRYAAMWRDQQSERGPSHEPSTRQLAEA